MGSLGCFLFLLVLSPVFVFGTHILLVRIAPRLRLSIHPLMTGAWAVAVTLLWLSLLLWRVFLKDLPSVAGLGAAVLYGLLTYSCLAFCYFQIFAMTETARRLHILYELFENGEMTLAQLNAEYGAPQMMAVRLARMVEIGQLHYDGTCYRLRGGFLLNIGRLMAFWAKWLGFPVSRSR